jgi:glycosyl hydrolase family 11
MFLKSLVMRKALFMSAAVAVFGCADADSGGEVPPFSGLYSGPTSGEGSVNGPVDSANTPVVDNSGDGSQASANGSTPSNSPAASEGQNANNLPIAPSNGGDGAASGSAAPGETGGTPDDSDGMQAGNGQAGNGQAGTGGDNEPPPPEPEPRPALDCSAPRPSLTAGTQSCSVNASGRVDGQSWFMWYSGSGGCITPYDAAGFKATWNNSGDFLARMGLQFDETKTFDQYGTIGADLAFSKTGTGGGYSFIGIYGWSNDPLVEYYIVENSYGNGPATPYATTQRGTFTVDGATYRIYTGTKTNQPSIHGNANFQQVFSVRQSPRECGHVSISEHFKQWQGMGIQLGKMYEARVLVEAGGGSGSIDFTSAYVTTSDN